jgi:hypothetical protein
MEGTGRTAPTCTRSIRVLALLLALPAPAAADTGPAVGVPRSAAAPAGPAGGAAACALLLTGEDDAGRTVLQSVAYSLDRPGVALAPRPAVAASARWSRLLVRGDDGGPGASAAPRLPADPGLIEDPTRELVWLRVPGLPACRPRQNGGAEDAGPAGVPELESGAPLVGIRNRDGYRPRVFPASLERRLRLDEDREVLLVRIPDGGGAEAGFLLDAGMRLVASILPPPAGSDPRYACAVPYREPAAGGGAPAGDDSGGGAPGDDPVHLLARALLLTGDDRAQEAIALLDRVARASGPRPALLVERGQRQFRIGRTAAAIRDFAAAAEADPAMHLARFNLGVALGSEGRYGEAIEAFLAAHRLRPEHPRTLFHLALALKAAGLLDRARGELGRLAGLDPVLAAELEPMIGL